MDNKKLISQALLDIAKNSTTEFIEVSQDSELIETAKKFNIVLPSPDLSVIKTVYAEIDKVNLNGVILPREAVETGLPTLIGKNINWEHQGAGQICGYIIDAKVNEDLIEITGVIFKSLFPEEMEMVKEKFQKKDLCVSFEIWNRNPSDGTSVVTELANGFRSINPIIFHGCGLLLTNPPACPKAKVYKLVAKVLSETEKIVKKVFGEDLIFASTAIEEPKCKECTNCTCEKDKEVQKVEEIKIEETIVEESKVRVCPECNEPMNDDETDICAKCLQKKQKLTSEEINTEIKSEETKTEEKSEETKTQETVVAETNPEETKVEEIKEEAQAVEVIDKKVISVTNEETTLVIETPDGKVERKGFRRTTRKFDDGTEEVFSEDYQAVQTYTEAQLEEKVNVIKFEKDVEVASLKTELEKLDKEIKNLKEELGKKDQEIAELNTPKVEEPIEMTVGSVENEVESETKKQAKQINDIIAAKGKK